MAVTVLFCLFFDADDHDGVDDDAHFLVLLVFYGCLIRLFWLVFKCLYIFESVCVITGGSKESLALAITLVVSKAQHVVHPSWCVPLSQQPHPSCISCRQYSTLDNILHSLCVNVFITLCSLLP